MFTNCLIMAGGSGTRLWPASSTKKPKQFLPIAKGKNETFFSMSLERTMKVTEKDSDRIIIIAGKSHLPFIIETCSKLSPTEKKNILLIPEPEAKNTAPAIACAVTYLRKTSNSNNVLVLTSDHIIKPIEVFTGNAETASDFAKKDNLVVFGIPPSRPETGYGYIKTGKTLTENVYSVKAFLEKPERKNAEKFTASKHYFWNSGMFAFSMDFIMEEFLQHAAEVIQPFEQLREPDEKAYSILQGLKVLDNWEGLEKAYQMTEKISFDNAIAEKCSRSVMVKAAFDWIDVGNWDEYSRLLSDNSDGNNFNGADVYTAGNCDGCFVDSDIPVALAGVEDLIVVIRSGIDGSIPTALIVRKGDTQRVKDVVEQIKKVGRTELL